MYYKLSTDGGCMAIIPIAKKNISQQIFDQILHNIRKGTWTAGAKLPSENELCQMFGVSRVPIREAMRSLNMMGITQTRQGEGSYVSEINPGLFMNSLLPVLVLSQKGMMDILEYRRIVEPENAALAARNADEGDLATMAGTLEVMDRIGRPVQEFSVADMEFHLDVARATKNTLLFNAANVIRDVLVDYYRKINEIMGVERAMKYHRLIFDAIAARDPDRARCWMQEHIATTIDDVSQKYVVQAAENHTEEEQRET